MTGSQLLAKDKKVIEGNMLKDFPKSEIIKNVSKAIDAAHKVTKVVDKTQEFKNK